MLRPLVLKCPNRAYYITFCYLIRLDTFGDGNLVPCAVRMFKLYKCIRDIYKIAEIRPIFFMKRTTFLLVEIYVRRHPL